LCIISPSLCISIVVYQVFDSYARRSYTTTRISKTTIENIPIIEEPKEICEVIKKLETVNYNVGEVIKIEEFEERRKKTKSKFVELERINWGSITRS